VTAASTIPEFNNGSKLFGPGIKFVGTNQRAAEYKRGDVTNHEGAMWVATCETHRRKCRENLCAGSCQSRVTAEGVHMQTLHEAGFVILESLMHIERTEGHMPNIIGLHSIADWGQGQVSIWVELDDPNANEGMGIIACHVDERCIAGMDQNEVWEALTGYHGPIFTEVCIGTDLSLDLPGPLC
jgi:hypothetical protein